MNRTPLMYDEQAAEKREKDRWDRGWIDRALSAINQVSANGDPFTIDDVREYMDTIDAGEPPSGTSLAVAFQMAKARNVCVATDKTQCSRKKGRNRSRVSVWQRAPLSRS